MGRLSLLRLPVLALATAPFVFSQPVVSPGGIVNAATFVGPVSPGSLVSIFGSNLAPQTASASTIPLPPSLDGVSVQFNGITAPLLFVSQNQINAQLPWEVPATGAVNVVVMNNGSPSAPQSVAIGPYSPGVFASGSHAIAIHQDGSLVAPVGVLGQYTSSPASAGETIEVLATGLGPVNPPGVTGNNSLDTMRQTTSTPVVLIEGIPAQVSFSGLSPQFVGVDQLNVVVPATAPSGSSVPLQIQIGGLTTTVETAIAIGTTNWPQWSQNPQHTGNIPLVGQDLGQILASVVYDTLAATEQQTLGELLTHYQVPLVDGNDVFMESKGGMFNSSTFSTATWGENRFTWQGSQLTEVWSYSSDWKPPGSLSDFFEPVFHAVLANGAVYVPGASGSIIQLDRATGAMVQRIAPFGTNPNTYETGPISADANGNLFYNAIQVVVGSGGFYTNDATDSWLVRVAPDGSFSLVSYKTLTSPEAPAGTASCLGTFTDAQLPWPPSPTAVPGSSTCGTQRVGLNIAPAIAPDGTIYSVTRAQFNSRYAFLVAINPDLSKKWAASLLDRFQDGCGVPVSSGGSLPPNGAPGGCRSGAPLGVDPATNRPGAGTVEDSSSSSPTVAPDGSILYGSYTRYNYAQGHLMHFDVNGNYLGVFGFGWDVTPAVFGHDGTWSAVIKNNHYGGLGSYCDDPSVCPSDRTATNPASPEQYFVSQIKPDMTLEWNFQNTNTQSCSRNPDGTLTCVSDHPNGFEWCVNAPVVDANGVVYANSEDGNLYSISQGGVLKQKIFQQLAIGAAYTPASLDAEGRIYTQNDGVLFVVGK
jgi:uncharacterized protein (TIGR03437 family)